MQTDNIFLVCARYVTASELLNGCRNLLSICVQSCFINIHSRDLIIYIYNRTIRIRARLRIIDLSKTNSM